MRWPGQAFRSGVLRTSWQSGMVALNTYRSLVDSSVREGMRILQAGCGWDKNGITRPYRKTCHVVGIDEDRRVAPLYHSCIALGSLQHIPLASEVFDVVLCEYVIEHVEEPVAALREMYRVLKPQGTLLLLTPNLYSYKSLVAYLTPHAFHTWVGQIRYGRGHEADMYPTRYRCNTSSRLKQSCREVGFGQVTVDLVTKGPTWFEKMPVLFELGHAFHLLIEHWKLLKGLRCALLIDARKQLGSPRDGAFYGLGE